jgi:hypothetical protein
MATTIWHATGEVLEREELLDGRFQVVLDGEAEGAAVALTLVWLLGREGEVPLAEGYVTVTADAGGELNASLAAGGVEASAETGAASVRARFVVDAVEGALAAPGDGVTCDLEVGAESWSGELRLSPAGGDP